MKLEIPYFSYSDIGKRAQAFLTEYHPSFEIPIPIEDIADVKMGLDIVPVNNLCKDFGLSGYLTRDRSAIFVDQFQADNYEEKFRYTLAHEVGHYVLHKAFYEDLPFEAPDEYIAWRLSMPPEDMSWFETHGDWFAGHLLVPTNRLEEICAEVVGKYQKIFSKFKTIPDDTWSYISNEVATYFEVNPPVAEIRIKKESIPQKIKLGGIGSRPKTALRPSFKYCRHCLGCHVVLLLLVLCPSLSSFLHIFLSEYPCLLSLRIKRITRCSPLFFVRSPPGVWS